MKTNKVLFASIALFLGLMGNSVNAAAHMHGPDCSHAKATTSAFSSIANRLNFLRAPTTTVIAVAKSKTPFLLTGTLCIDGKNIPFCMDHTTPVAPSPSAGFFGRPLVMNFALPLLVFAITTNEQVKLYVAQASPKVLLSFVQKAFTRTASIHTNHSKTEHVHSAECNHTH